MVWITVWLVFSLYSVSTTIPRSFPEELDFGTMRGLLALGLKIYLVAQAILLAGAILGIYLRKKWGKQVTITWAFLGILNGITAIISFFLQRQGLLNHLTDMGASQNAGVIFGAVIVLSLFFIAVDVSVISYVRRHAQYFSE